MPRRVTVALSLTWHDLDPAEVLPLVEGVKGMLKGTDVQVDVPEVTARALGLALPLDSRQMGPGYMARGRAHGRVLQETLDAYEACGRNAMQTAVVMRVDRNTIYNRLTRAKQKGIVAQGRKET